MSGKINFKLKSYLKENNIPMMRLSKEAKIDYRTVLRYCNNNVKNIKVFILESICNTLNCNVEDIIEFIRDDEQKPDDNA